MASVTDDILHVHGSHDDVRDRSKVANQLRPFHLTSMVREPGHHPVKVPVDAQLHGDKGDASSLLDPHDHRTIVVLNRKRLSEASHLRLMAGGR